MLNSKKAFTIMELLISIMIIAVITAFGMPKFGKTFDKADERNIVANLAALRAAVHMFEAGGGILGNWNSLATINTNLSLSVLDTKATYMCNDVGGFSRGCTATHPKGWALQFHDEHSGGGIHCSAGVCPSCPAAPGSCG